MRLQCSLALLVAGILLSEPARAAEPVTRSWSDLAQRVQPNWTLRLVLPDGVTVDGKSASFGADALTMNVVRSSNRKLHPKGQISIPRGQVRTLGIRPPRTKGRTLGVLIPIGVAVGVGWAAGNATSEEMFGGFPTGAIAGGLVAIVGGVLGYFAGRAVDRRFDPVTVTP